MALYAVFMGNYYAFQTIDIDRRLVSHVITGKASWMSMRLNLQVCISMLPSFPLKQLGRMHSRSQTKPIACMLAFVRSSELGFKKVWLAISSQDFFGWLCGKKVWSISGDLETVTFCSKYSITLTGTNSGQRGKWIMGIYKIFLQRTLI